jgi:hypothetical protein
MKDPCKTCKKDICEEGPGSKCEKYRNFLFVNKLKSISISSKAMPTRGKK